MFMAVLGALIGGVWGVRLIKHNSVNIFSVVRAVSGAAAAVRMSIATVWYQKINLTNIKQPKYIQSYLHMYMYTYIHVLGLW